MTTIKNKIEYCLFLNENAVMILGIKTAFFVSVRINFLELVKELQKIAFEIGKRFVI